jgi:predicted dehydrogenase
LPFFSSNVGVKEGAMGGHISTSVLLVVENGGGAFESLRAYLSGTKYLRLEVKSQLPADLSGWDVVLTSSDAQICQASGRLSEFVNAGAGVLHFIDSETGQIPDLFGAQPEGVGPQCELRILFDQSDHPISARIEDGIYIKGLYHPLRLSTGNTETLLYTDWHFQHKAVLVQRRYGSGMAACTTLWDFDHPVLCQILCRLIRQLGGSPMAQGQLGVGILGYAPSVGKYHGQGVAHTPGLELHAVCDLNGDRLQQAQIDFADIRCHTTAQGLINDAGVDLVIIATPPNTHAQLAVQMMAAGKHVICEKPLALNSAETKAMVEEAKRQGVHLSCHQNRRWDLDYLAIRQILADDLIGELFYMEVFVGGFSHPCGYWHSDTAVSGGTSYDWGGHYIDWIVSLFDEPIESVSGTRHKRVWHDVTNADQESIRIQFRSGGEAQFIHSDIAAARKPKWYLLGTRGAVVGQWRDVSEYTIDPVHYFHRHDIPPTEMPPDMTVYQRHGSGKITTLKPAIADRSVFGFHRNLADHLLEGEPLTAPLADSICVVAVLEAASRSMASAGAIEVLNV